MKNKINKIKIDINKNKKFKINYQIFFIFLAIYSFATTLLDLHGDIHISKNPFLEFIDFSIYLIFAIDYIIRFIFAKHKANFIENNIPDLISIIPYYSIFRLFRIFKIRKFAKVFKHLKLSKFYLFVKKTYKKIKKFLKLNGLIYLLIMAGLGIIISALVISYVEKMNYSDSLWWAFVTATTVGYGDISPKTHIGRFVAIFLMLIGIGTFGMITGTIATYFLNKQNDIAPTDDLDKYILNSENFSDSEKKEIITFIHFVKSKREK